MFTYTLSQKHSCQVSRFGQESLAFENFSPSPKRQFSRFSQHCQVP